MPPDADGTGEIGRRLNPSTSKEHDLFFGKHTLAELLDKTTRGLRI